MEQVLCYFFSKRKVKKSVQFFKLCNSLVFVILAFLYFSVVINSHFFQMSCAPVFGEWKEGGIWGDCYSLQGSSRGENPRGIKLVFTASETWE